MGGVRLAERRERMRGRDRERGQKRRGRKRRGR
jgi:hypothetical protein